MNDKELWEKIHYYEKEEEKGSKIILVSGGIMAVGMMFGVSTGKMVFALPFLLFGVILILMGGKKSTTSNKEKNALISNEIGPYAKQQYEDLIGEFQVIGDKKAFRKILEESNILPPWTHFEGSNFLKGDYEGLPYVTGNVHIWHEQRGRKGDDLDQEIYRTEILQGIWFHFTLQEDRIIQPEEEEELRKICGGNILLEVQNDGMNLGIWTNHRIYSYHNGVGPESIHTMKTGFMDNLQYEFFVLREVKNILTNFKNVV